MEEFLNSMAILSSAILVYIFNKDIILEKILWETKFKPRTPNGNGRDIYLYDARILGIILEGIRFREVTTPYGISEVRYRFLMFLGIFLIPIGCYRVIDKKTIKTGYKEYTTQFMILGTESWNVLEIISIYLLRLSAVTMFIFSIIAIVAFIGLISEYI